MKQQTAMQQHIEHLNAALSVVNKLNEREAMSAIQSCINNAEIHLEAEKQQIIDAVNNNEAKATKQANFWIKKASNESIDLVESVPEAGLKYYNEKFGNQ